MLRTEFEEALALIEEITAQDHKVGTVLSTLLHHIADLAGVDTTPTPATAEAPQEVTPAQSEEAAPTPKGKK